MIDSEIEAPLVRVWLLGPFYAERREGDGSWKPIEKQAWEGSYARPLLLRLLCVTARRATRSTLLDDLWPETPLHLAEKYLNNAASKLRQILHKEMIKPIGPHGAGGYQLGGQLLLWTDSDACDTLLAEAERPDLSRSQAMLLLEQACQQFERGEMLEGESGQWCHALRSQREAALRYCRLSLAQHYEAQGRLWQARSQYHKLLEANPVDEDALCRFLTMLHRHGMNSDLRTVFEEAKKRFEEYDIPLSTTVRTLVKQLTSDPISLEVYIPRRLAQHEQYVLSPLVNPARTEQENNHEYGPYTPWETEGDLHLFTLQAYEDMLTLAWEAFYTSNAQRSANAVNHWLLFLKQQVHSVGTATSRNTILMFLCCFLQLASVLARDRTDFPYAFSAIHEAIALAFQLENAELIASSLYRRAKLYAAQRHYEAALSDLEAALPYASRSRNPLRCYISMFLAEIYSLFAPGNKEFFSKSLAHLDSVGQSVREKGILDGDGSFVKVDIAGLYMIRGDVLRRNGEISEARSALALVQTYLPKEFTRWQGNHRLSTAQLFLAEGDIANTCQQIHHALDIFQATSSRSVLAKTQRIYRAVQQVEFARSEVKELGMRLSSGEMKDKYLG